ncbi:hypothetical protein D9756_006999 [Leucocoprinus leucothites]|uniref:Uncharacterized protein n=1 Tax=Leucocoprinus leucothites TaxID=201217 RepID=A0A8H5D5W7_9AGAR|nr:hypothetical protein D9756_006999 [Leucoagaricus leucothites]
MSTLSATNAASLSLSQTSDYDLVVLGNANKFVGVMSIGGSFAYVLYGVSCSQIIWYFRSYPQDPLTFKAFIGFVGLIDSMNLLWTIWELYWMMILRGIDQDPNFFVNCDFWAINVRKLIIWLALLAAYINIKLQAVLILTELNCALVELFFILRMWRFAEKKRLAIFAFVPYIFSTGFNFRYIKGMIEIPCYPEMSVNSPQDTLRRNNRRYNDLVIVQQEQGGPTRWRYDTSGPGTNVLDPEYRDYLVGFNDSPRFDVHPPSG